jgi:hypothetical protein
MTNELRLIKRELRRTTREIEIFEKRSKMIKIIYARDIFNRHYTQINITKKNKIVNEMIEYIKSFCDYVEIEKDGSMWFRNYNDLADTDTEYSKAEYQFCIHLIK